MVGTLYFCVFALLLFLFSVFFLGLGTFLKFFLEGTYLDISFLLFLLGLKAWLDQVRLITFDIYLFVIIR